MTTLEELNGSPAADFVAALGGIFEHSPWVAERVACERPFGSIRELHRRMAAVVMAAGDAEQLSLIRAHPQLAGRAAVRGELTAESTREQRGAGLSACTPPQFAALMELNARYESRHGFPFILAVKGHTPDSVIAALRMRVALDPAQEKRVALDEICRIAWFRLQAQVEEPLGAHILSMAGELADLSEQPDGLTCTYLTPVHRATAQRLRDFMLAAGLDAHVDAVGNVVGVLRGAGEGPHLLTGSHYDTVIDAGRFDGRLGILLPIAVAARLQRQGCLLPFTLEIVAFAEEEGVRFGSTFLGSRALAGRFDAALLDRTDSAGVTMRAALEAAGHDPADVPKLRREPREMRGFVEVHIEQGPVLLTEKRPVGVVTAIAGCTRIGISVSGMAGHAGTVPMGLRRDAAAGAAEMVLAVEERCAGEPDLVGTVGRLEVPGGAVNVIPGRCELTLDVRSGNDLSRRAAIADLTARMHDVAAQRGLTVRLATLHDVDAVPCSSGLCQALASAAQRVTGEVPRRLPSGAGHDAMMMATVTPVAMLFVRCGNDGISHHPSETMSEADAHVAADVFENFLMHFEAQA